MPYEFGGEGTQSRGGGAYTFSGGEWVPTAEYDRRRRTPTAGGAAAVDEGGFAEDVARMYDERVEEVMSRVPGSELRDVSQAGLLDVLREGPYADYRGFDPGGEFGDGEPVSTGSPTADLYVAAAREEGGRAEGYSPEEVAFQSYWPEMESRLYGSLSRKGFTGGGAPSAAVAKGAAEFAAPLAIEHARGQERRRNQYVQDLFSSLGISLSGGQTISGMPWPDWMGAAEAEGASGGGTVIQRPGYRIGPTPSTPRAPQESLGERRRRENQATQAREAERKRKLFEERGLR